MIAGLGSIGRRHFRNLLALGERDLLLYRTFQSTQSDDELDGFPVETDLKAALSHKPDAVIVSNPTSLHLAVAIPAARAGCHLMLEKPVSNTLEGISRLKSEVRANGGSVFVAYNYRFHPSLRRLAEMLQSGDFGRPLSFRSHWGEYLPGWHPWEDYRQGYSARADLGGGVILTLSHTFDYIRWLFGEVQSLWAFSGTIGDLDLQVEDTAEIGLRMKNGALGSLHLDFNQQPPQHKLEVVCTHGTLRWDYVDGSAVGLMAGTEFEQIESPPSGFTRNDLYLDEMRHFLKVCRGEAVPLCSLEDGIKALKLALAAHSSQASCRLINL